MIVLAIHGSPRKNGNSAYLADVLLREWEKRGAETELLHISDRHVFPCTEDTVCEKKGFCPIDDDMEEVFGLLRKADVVVLAAPAFFYGFPAQCKALIDRCQVLWARKYRLKLQDPGAPWRKGILCSVGATKGENLFDGMKLTAAYFFDALGADFAGSLLYRQVEHPGDLEAAYDVPRDAAALVRRLQPNGAGRKRIVFSSKTNPAAAHAACIYLRLLSGELNDCALLSTELSEEERKLLVSAFAEEGIDAEFYPFPYTDRTGIDPDDTIVTVENPPLNTEELRGYAHVLKETRKIVKRIIS